MLELIKRLCDENGISGREDKVRELIIKEIEPYADEITVDPLGNLCVFKKGASKPKHRVMIDAHMDEVGFIITSITPNGSLCFECVGGISSAVMLGRHVFVGDNKIPGVIGVTPVHLLSADKRTQFPEKSSLVIDIGAASEAQAREMVDVGEYACFDSEFCTFGDGYVKAKALDDRAGCAIMIEMIKKEQPFDLYYCFSVGEETGNGMAGTAVDYIKPDYAIVAETTTAADLAGVEPSKRVCSLGDGPVVSFMDRRTVYSKQLYDKAFEIAKRKGIKIQSKSIVAGGNNAGVIHKSAGGVKTIAVSLACRYLHSPSCVIKADDIYQSQKLIESLAEDFAND